MAECHGIGVAAVFAVPQVAGPSLLPGRVVLPSSQAIFTNWPTPVWFIMAKGFFFTVSFSV